MQQPFSAIARSLFIRMTGTLLLVMLILVCIFSKSTLFLAANAVHTHWLDGLFELLTNLGDGTCALGVALMFFILKRKNLSYKLMATFFLSGAIAQVLKHCIHAPRPKAFFAPGIYSHFIEGVTNGGLTSFPSGHATTAFAIASMLAFSFGCKKWCRALFTLATAVVYSRIYLGQHFVEDTLAGMMIGVFSSLCIEFLYAKYFANRQPRQIAMAGHEPLSIEL